MENYIDIIVDKQRYIQRTPHSKIMQKSLNDETINTFENIDLLSSNVLYQINYFLDVKERPEDFFEYKKKDDGTICITKLKNDQMSTILIPKEINGMEVSEIKSILSFNKNVEKVILQDNITELPTPFATNANKLIEVILPDTINTISSGCFLHCVELSSINLENINRVEALAFNFCLKLKEISMPNLRYLHRGAFMDCSGLVKFSAPRLEETEDKVFNGDVSLEEVDLGDKVDSLGVDYFLYCESLHKFKFPSRLEAIGAGCFSHCKSMSEFNLPESLKEIQRLAFADTAIESLILPKGTKTIDNAICFNCKKLKEIKMSKNTQKHKEAFSLEQELLIELYESPKTKIKNFLKNMER